MAFSRDSFVTALGAGGEGGRRCFAPGRSPARLRRNNGNAMRLSVSIGVFLVFGTMAAAIAEQDLKSNAAATDNLPAVDVELVIATDVSYSMDTKALAAQREAYAEAIVSQAFLEAVAAGPNKKIAVTYFEWSAFRDQRLLVPWRVIDGLESASAVAAEIAKTPIRRGTQTSISAAINFAIPLFDTNPYRGLRRLIDITGDGPNTVGGPVAGARDAALAKGIAINGLAIMAKQQPNVMDIADLDLYYEDCVIGGPGAFVVANKVEDELKEAVRTKLIREIRGPAQDQKIVPATEKQTRVSCLIGEQMWQERWGRPFEQSPKCPDPTKVCGTIPPRG